MNRWLPRLAAIALLAVLAASSLGFIGSAPRASHPGPGGTAVERTAATTGTSVPNPGAVAATFLPQENTTVAGNWPIEGDQPTCGILDGATGQMWVCNANRPIAPVAIVNLTTGQVVGYVPGLPTALAMVYDAGTGNVYAADAANDTVLVVSGRTGELVAPAIPVGYYPDDLVYDAASGEVFVANANSGNVSVISDRTNTLASSGIFVGYLTSSGDTLALDTSTNLVFAVSYAYDEVSVISPTGLYVQSTFYLPTGASPTSVAYYAANQTLFFGSYNLTVYVYNATSYALLDAIYTGTDYLWVAADPYNGQVYFASTWPYLAALNGRTYAWISTTIPTGVFPEGFVFEPTTGRVDVINVWDVDVTVLNGSTDTPLPTTIVLSWEPVASAFDPANGRLYVAATHEIPYYDSTPGVLLAIDPKTERLVAPPAPVGIRPQSVVYDSANGNLYVSNSGSDNISVVNGTTARPIASISLGCVPVCQNPGAEVWDPSTGLLFVADLYGGDVSVVATATNSLAASIPVSSASASGSIALDPAAGRLFVGNPYGSNITVIATANQSVVGTIAIPNSYPAALLFDPADGVLVVANYYGSSLALVDPTSGAVLGIVPVAYAPESLGFNPVTDGLYVGLDDGYEPNVGGGLLVLDGRSVAGTEGAGALLNVGMSPTSITYGAVFGSSSGGELWVSNAIGGTLAVVGTPFLSASLTAAPAAVDVGLRLALTGAATGGTGPIAPHFAGLPAGCAATGWTVACTPTATGTSTVTLSATDALGQQILASVVLTVNPALALTAQATPTRASAGTPVVFNATVSGGTGPTNLTWTFGDGSSATGPAPSHAFTAAGTYVVRVWANDSGNGSAEKTLDVSISAASGGSFFGSGAASGLGLVIGLAIGAAVGGLIGWVATRRRRTAPPPNAWTPPAEPPVAPPPPGA
jgi:YVTN family beta-propeller protein